MQLSCLLPDTPINRTIAESRAKQIEIDIATGSYDETLAKYRPSKSASNKPKENPQDPATLSEDSTIESLVNYWLESSKTKWKLNTYLKHKALIRIAINNSKEVRKPFSSFSVSSFSSEILKATKQPKEVTKTLSSAFNWLIAHGLIINNPLSNLIKTLPKAEWEVNPRANAFTPDEKERLLNHLSEHYPHYRTFVEFLFLTGCRPSEAVGLMCDQIEFTDNGAVITFDRSISYRNGIAIYNAGSKNNKSRKFPCNPRLTELLSIRCRVLDCKGYVFGNNSKPLHYPNFVKRQWKKSMEALGLNHTPYDCRDTFLTEQIKAGKPLAIICLWCDTSVAMLQKHYLDRQSAIELMPD